jgi:transposase-like protein
MLEDMIVKIIRQAMPIVVAIPETCKFCGSRHIVRYGHYRMVQRWWCKDCRRKFVHNEALPGMRVPAIQVASALSMYYEGMSLHGIRRNLEQTYGNRPSNSTIYEWVIKFTKQAIKIAEDYKPEVGDVWVADETVLKIEGENVWFWDIIDEKTRFLLATHISSTRTTRDAKILMERAVRRAGKIPEVIITDKLAAYISGIELTLGTGTKHIRAKRLTAEPGTQLAERFHGTLKVRTKVMRGLKTRKSAKLITDGWLVHYNFFRPHEALGDKTPAEKAGIKFPFKNWLHIVKGG